MENQPNSHPRGPRQYRNALQIIQEPLPILADHPQFVHPLEYEHRFLTPPVMDEPDGKLLIRSWRYWYNARGIIEMENRLEAAATAIVDVHPWGLDDGHGLETPEPAGCAFFCTREKNQVAIEHMRDVLNPFLERLREHVSIVAHSLPGIEDPIRKLLYASILTKPEGLDLEKGEQLLASELARHGFRGQPLVDTLKLEAEAPLNSYFEQTMSTNAEDHYNGAGFWDLPMPVSKALDMEPGDIVIYDGEGYEKARDYLKQAGIRHILLTGYATDMCVAGTTCGYENLSQDFNLFLVGDATLATFPGSTTPKYATQVALANAALDQMVTQVNWVRLEGDEQ